MNAAFLDPQVPFSVEVGGAELRADTLLRHLPGKRLVCTGQWQGRDVVAKIYFDSGRHAVHAQREAAGVQALIDRQITTPALLHRRGDKVKDVLIFERIVPAESALDVWTQEDAEKRRDTLHALVRAVGTLHNAGLVQEDMHLGNFLFAHERVYTLDGAAIRIRPGPVGRVESFDNLGLLFAQLPPACDRWTAQLYADYARARNWQTASDDGKTLQKAVDRRRAARKHEYLSKIFRTSTPFQAHRDRRLYWVCDREYDSPTMRALVSDPDLILNGAQRLKDGNTSTVSVVVIDGCSLLVKRYNLKSALHAFVRALRETRAAVSWRNAHRLRFYGLPTPRPVALVEKRWGPFKRVSYFICDYVDAENCRRYFRRNDVAEVEKKAVAEKVAALFDEMAALRIAHGDTKGSNFLVAETQVQLIDLDAMREYGNAREAAKAHRRDVLRFLRNWDELPELQQAFAKRLGIASNGDR